MPGATTQLTAKVWHDMLKVAPAEHMWIPEVWLSKAAPDYLRAAIHECHDSLGVKETDDYTMWIAKQCLAYIYAKGFDDVQPKIFNDVGFFHDKKDSKEAIRQILGEWFSHDPARHDIADRVIRESYDDYYDISYLLETAMDYEIENIYRIMGRHIKDYLRKVNREGF